MGDDQARPRGRKAENAEFFASWNVRAGRVRVTLAGTNFSSWQGRPLPFHISTTHDTVSMSSIITPFFSTTKKVLRIITLF